MVAGSDDMKRRVFYALLMVVLVFAIGTVGYRFLSPAGLAVDGRPAPVTWLQSLYMTVISLTTVGYGETLPVQRHPRMIIFTSVLLVVGIGVMTFTFSIITAFIVERSVTDAFRRRRMKKRIDKLTGHYIVCGASGTAASAIQEFLATRKDYVVVDSDEGILEKLAQEHDSCVLEGDATDEDVLLEAGVARAKGLLANLPNDRDNLFLVMTARQLNPDLRIAAKVMEPKNNRKFRTAGADALASPQRIGGLRLVSELLRPSVVSFLDLMLRGTNQTLRVEEVIVSKGSALEGKSLSDLEFRRRFGLQVLAIRGSESGPFHYNPDPSRPLSEGSILIVQGDVDRVEELRRQVRP